MSTINDLPALLVRYGIMTARCAQDCAMNKLNPKPGESTECTCGLKQIREIVQREMEVPS